MKKKIVEDFNRKSQHKKWTKRKMLNLAISKGTADANATVEIRNAGGTVIGTGTADGTGAFTVTIPAGEAGANETLTAVAKNASGTESTPTTFQTPADPNTPVATPIVETVTGSTTKGYEVTAQGLLKLEPPLRFAMHRARFLVLQQLELTENIQ